MKFTFLSFLFLAAIVALSSCKSEKKAETTPTTEAPAETAPAQTPAADAQAVPTPGGETQATPAGSQQAQTLEPAQNAKGVWHYTCPKGCPGGAGAQGTCAKCGGPLQHNAGYHAQ